MDSVNINLNNCLCCFYYRDGVCTVNKNETGSDFLNVPFDGICDKFHIDVNHVKKNPFFMYPWHSKNIEDN